MQSGEYSKWGLVTLTSQHTGRRRGGIAGQLHGSAWRKTRSGATPSRCSRSIPSGRKPVPSRVVHLDPGNLLAGRNVTAIALQIPDVTVGGIDVAVWARISLFGHGP